MRKGRVGGKMEVSVKFDLPEKQRGPGGNGRREWRAFVGNGIQARLTGRGHRKGAAARRTNGRKKRKIPKGCACKGRGRGGQKKEGGLGAVQPKKGGKTDSPPGSVDHGRDTKVGPVGRKKSGDPRNRK